MVAISNREPLIGVEYDCLGRRRVRYFQRSFCARRFYLAKLQDGKNPKVVSLKGEKNG